MALTHAMPGPPLVAPAPPAVVGWQVQVHLAARNPEQEKLEAEKRAEDQAKLRWGVGVLFVSSSTSPSSLVGCKALPIPVACNHQTAHNKRAPQQGTAMFTAAYV